MVDNRIASSSAASPPPRARSAGNDAAVLNPRASADTFADRLKRAEAQDGREAMGKIPLLADDSSAGATSETALADAAAGLVGRDGEDGDDGESLSDESSDEATAMAAALSTPAGFSTGSIAALPPASLAGPDEAAMAHIDRIAALIAEAATSGAAHVFTVDFAGGDAIAAAAVIGFDASGAVSLTLVDTNPALGPAAIAGLRSALIERLDRRRIAVGRIDMGDEPSADADPLPTASGRK